MKKIYRNLLAGLLIFGGTTAGMAQQGFSAPSQWNLQANRTDQVPTYTLPSFNWTQIYLEDGQNDKNGSYPRLAVTQATNLDLNNSGVWTTLANGDRLWKIRVASADAEGLIFSFHNMFIPNGARVSVYNEDMSDVLGPFDASYSPASGIMAIGIVQGEAAVVEYYEPAHMARQGRFTIKEVGHAYRMTNPFVTQRDFGDSDGCQVNVNCTPEGSSWQDEKRGVARILLKDGANWGWCTGSLINNTAEDCTPYFLTALHCGETASTADRNQWFFYFNYESSGCSNGSNPVPNPYSPPAGSPTTQGCQLVAHSNDGGGASGSDFQLLNLNNLTPAQISTWNLYFNGWNRSTTAATGGVGIHHPSGDIKKISTYTGTLASASWGGPAGTHWRVIWTATTNGHGVTEGGSSGSPIFNSSGLIVGSLTGGSSYCSATSSPDFYGKMSYHWSQNASPFGGHLSQFLDPISSGAMSLAGTYSPCTPSAPTCAISASATTVSAGGSVNFTDNSTGAPTSWSWNFGGGGTPGASTAQNPSNIVFNTPGVYNVTMTATNAQGSCNTSVIITVNASTGCDTLNFPPPGTLIYGYGSASLGYVAGTNSYDDVSKAQRFASYAPYTHVNGGMVYLANATANGTNAIARFHIWNEAAGTPGTSLASLDVTLADLEAIVTGAGGPALISLAFSQPVNVGGAPFYFGVEMVNFAAGDTIAIITNTAGNGSAATNSWEQWSDLTWHNMSSAWTLPNDPNDFIDLFFSPFMTDLPVTANITASGSTTGCSGASMSFDASTSVNATSYDWTLPAGTPSTGTGTSFSSSISAPGTYTVYLEANGVCGGYSLDSINTITINASPVVTATATAENCGSGNGTITAVATGGSGSGYMYSLNGGTPQSSGSFTGLSAGIYSVAVSDGNGCTANTSAVVSNNAGGVAVVATTVADPCGSGNGSLTATATGGTGPYEYSIDGVNFQVSPIFNGLTAGSYTVFAEDQSNGCTGNTTVTVTANNYTLTVAASPTPENCGSADGSIVVTASGGTAPYQFSNNGGSTFQAGGTFSSLSSNTYNIVVEDQFGCSGTTTAVVTNVGGPTITSTAPTNPLCSSGSTGSITINATGATQYSINGGSTFQASNVFTGLAAGTYNIVASDGGSCDATSVVTLTAPSAVTATATNTNTGCVTGGTITAAGSGGSGTGYQYSINNGSTFQASPNFTGVTAGTYLVVVQDGNGCQSGPFTVVVGGTSAITLTTSSSDETCSQNNGSITLSATGGAGSGYQYSINGGTTFQGTGNFTGLSDGTYNILVQDGSGCQATNTVTLSDQGAVNGTITANQSICSGTSAILQATGGTSYTWTPGGQTTATITVSPTSTTAYSVLIDNGTCTQILNSTVTVTATPITAATADLAICAGQSTTLTASGGTSYQWTPGGQTTASITVNPTITTTYQVQAFNGTCGGNIEPIVVTVNPAPTAVAAGTPTTVSISSGGTVNFSSAGSTSTGVTYVWDFGDGNTSASANPSHSYTAPGVYTVILTVSDANCSTTDIITITVIDDTNVEENIFAQSISAYPNPTNGELNLSFALATPRNIQVEVFNSIGALVKTANYNGMSTGIGRIYLGDEADGFYFVKVRSGEDTVTMRVSVIK
jgi:PKD repeat protein